MHCSTVVFAPTRLRLNLSEKYRPGQGVSIVDVAPSLLYTNTVHGCWLAWAGSQHL